MRKRALIRLDRTEGLVPDTAKRYGVVAAYERKKNRHPFELDGKLSVEDGFPSWRFDEGYRKQSIGAPDWEKGEKYSHLASACV